MKKYKIILHLFLFPVCAFAQTLQGKITDTQSEPLTGANIVWAGTTIGTVTDAKGQFEITLQNITDKKLVISFVGYRTDTLNIAKDTFILHKLSDTQTLGEVTITGKRPDNYISAINPIKTEVITSVELTKGACCDLAGCFNTNASVQLTTTNIVTNSQELRILGLSGIYNQTLFDGMPLIQGLSFTYGISSMPGILVDNIYVAKGTTSVLQGYESISGQINVEPKEPGKADKLLLNIYLNSFLEKHFNAIYSTPIGKRKEWQNLFAFHTVQPSNKFDKDNDTFLDLPLLTRYMFYDKIKYRDDKSFGWSSRIGLMYLNEQRIGGQTMFNAATDKGSSTVYGQTVNIQQPTVYTKSGYRFNDDNAITFLGGCFFQKQNSFFGETKYDAAQQNVYSNLQYELKWKEKHDFKTGISLRYFNLEENISFTANPLNKTFAGNDLKNESIPGIFAENIFHWKEDKVSLITGVRLDHHNQFGYYFTPRTMLKLQPAFKTIIRASIGTGWRTANIFSENINLLSSQRDIVFTQALKPEEAFNYGVNMVQSFEIKNIEGYISADFFRTQFQNQIFPDYDTDPAKAFIGNFTGTSVSNGFQTDFNITFYKVFTTKISYNYLDVFRSVNGQKNVLPFNSLHKMLATLSYKPKSEKWHIDVNTHWFGEQNLPNTSTLPNDMQRPNKSKPYATANAQFTYNIKKFELYAGCENIFDYRQEQPIISYQNPFSPYFDTSSVWGPTRGQEFYIGARFRIK
ncbi:MAG TPA: TonB-dependent receptor [Bacteroidia bacterium]|nr:TonB-dependent receptor [Bacteroidia bacterium]